MCDNTKKQVEIVKNLICLCLTILNMATNLDDLPVSGESESNVNIKITEQNQIVNNSVNKLEEQRKNDL